MISYLIDGVLLVALLATSVQVALMYREIRRLRRHHGEYREILEETGDALETAEAAVRDMNDRGSRIAAALGERIDEAEDLMARLDDRLRASRASFAQLEAEPQRPFLAYSAGEPGRRALQHRLEPNSSAYTAPASFASRAAAREEPTLGDYLGNWRVARPQDFRRAGRPERI